MKTGKKSAQEQLSDLFGSYKAEWLRERVFELFAEPTYFPELVTSSPCVLIGGRGTGKTTVLRCMSYEGQYAISGRRAQTIPRWRYFGMYYRVNTNRVTAFSGPEITNDRWVRLFAHYLNLILCEMVVRFLEWYQVHSPTPLMAEHLNVADIARGLAIEPAVNIAELSRSISQGKLLFEAHINNVATGAPVQLSMQGAPIDELFYILRRIPAFREKHFFFLLDEYENFQDYQQQVVNTLIKHSGELYSFKIGVRELGWRVRTTLNANEQLISPADYVRVSITEKLDSERFAEFALRVANERIRRIDIEGPRIDDVSSLLPGISDEEEALLLDGDSGTLSEASSKLFEVVPSKERPQFDSLTPLQRYCLITWSEHHKISALDVWQSYVTDPSLWADRFNNYCHSLLYTIRARKRGIRKYYCGSRVFVQMSARNIRYFLELVDQSIALHIAAGKAVGQGIVPETQTLAAQKVGQTNLSELEGLSVHGGRLTKLVLGLGRVFQVMASDTFGHTPEVNQFHLSYGNSEVESTINECIQLLNASVMHIALLRFPGDKPADESDTREFDYMLHPIFSAFFSFSYRRKRRLVLSPSHLLALVNDHRRGIREVLAAQNRDDKDSLPDQLWLFGSYYDVTQSPSSDRDY